jgi:hypothetical protein
MGEFAFQSFAPILSCLEFKRKSSNMRMQDTYENDLGGCRAPMNIINGEHPAPPFRLQPSHPQPSGTSGSKAGYSKSMSKAAATRSASASARSRASAQRNVGSTGSVPRSGGTSKKRSRGNMEGGDVADPEERRSKRMSISRPCKPSPPPPASASSAQTKADPGKPGKKRDPVLQTASYGVEMLSFPRGHAINFCIVGESLSPTKR